MLLVLFSAALLTASVFNLTNAQIIKPSGLQSPEQKSQGVKITNPINGEQFYINGSKLFNGNGDRLSISGFSVFNKSITSDCSVSIIINNVKPYQKTNATGLNGSSDYSNWNYYFGSGYTPLKEGPNKITSKLTCQPGNKLAYYSINITGVKFNGTFPNKENVFVGNNALISKVPNTIKLNSNGSIQQITKVPMPVNSSIQSHSLSVSIISPKSGDKVVIDKPIQINGTSDYPYNYSCEVSVADGNLPGVIVPNSSYQSNFKKTTPTGSNGTNDYRNWMLSMQPTQTNIKNGTQPITAKLECNSPFKLSAFAKINVVGINSKPIELLSMDVNIDKSGTGLNQKIIITVLDSSSGKPIEGVLLTGKLNSAVFTGTTDINGKHIENIPASISSNSSTLDVIVTAKADGYKAKKTSTSLGTSGLKANTINNSINDNRDTDEKDLANKIMEDVQKQLSKQGINIPLPFN